MTLQDYYTIPQAAPLIGKGQATLYRWVKSGKLPSIEYGGIPFISYVTIQSVRIKSCATCYHSNDSVCSCRETTEVTNPCSDWYPIELGERDAT